MPTAAKRKLRAKRLAQTKRFLREHTWGVMITILILIALILFVCVIAGASPKEPAEQETVQEQTPRYESGFICAITTQVPYYTEELSEAGTVARGMQITYSTDKSVECDGIRYYLTYFSTLDCGYVSEENLTQDPAAVVAEKAVYVRTPQNLRVDKDTLELGTLVEKGAELQVLSYEGTTDGIVDLYQVAYQGQTGYISGQYVSTVQEEANDVYDRFGVYAIHAGRGDKWGGGDAESLDYFPRTKASFEDNKMPNPCYAIYLTCDPAILKDIDKYIEYAKSTKINAFVVNIMDGTSIGYDSPVYEEYSPTAYQYAQNSVADYQAVIQKIKDAGFYVIGRLTTFNDSFFCQDHPEYAIADGSGESLYVAASYWPSAFCRYVWEYKVALAIDAVQTMGFNEIQFDYVRFPDNTDQYEASGDIDFRNEYGETKAQAIQRFLMYATDILHEYGVYVGADVFGETSGNYVTAYGQYWPAISNVVDVISGMPYPDHFARNGAYRPWEHPYETLLDWAESAAKRQAETPTPAVDRTWIQAYNAIQPPYNEYGVQEIGDEIRALLQKLRARIPGLVIRTSLITGLPGEGEEEFQQLCEFLKEFKLERAGTFAFSPEEGTKAALMEYPDKEVAQERAEIIGELQSRIMDEYNASCEGKIMQVLCDGYDPDEDCYYGRTYADSPDIDGRIWFTSSRHVKTGEFVNVCVVGAYDGELTGMLEEDMEDNDDGE